MDHSGSGSQRAFVAKAYYENGDSPIAARRESLDVTVVFLHATRSRLGSRISRRPGHTYVRQLFFGNHIVSRFSDIRLPRSPDLSGCVIFSLRDHLKSKVYSTRPTTLLQSKTRESKKKFALIPAEMSQRVLQHLHARFRECIQRNG